MHTITINTGEFAQDINRARRMHAAREEYERKKAALRVDIGIHLEDFCIGLAGAAGLQLTFVDNQVFVGHLISLRQVSADRVAMTIDYEELKVNPGRYVALSAIADRVAKLKLGIEDVFGDLVDEDADSTIRIHLNENDEVAAITLYDDQTVLASVSWFDVVWFKYALPVLLEIERKEEQLHANTPLHLHEAINLHSSQSSS